MPQGFTQKLSRRSGSRAVIWPATTSSKPKREKRRKAAARRSLRWRRSSAGVAKTGGRGTRSMKALWTGEAADGDGCGMGTSVMQSVGERNCASADGSWEERSEERGATRAAVRKAGLLPIVFVMYAHATGGPFGLEDMVTTRGPGLTLLDHLVFDRRNGRDGGASAVSSDVNYKKRGSRGSTLRRRRGRRGEGGCRRGRRCHC